MQETVTHNCPECGSHPIVKNGRTAPGKQKTHCRTCGAYGTLPPQVRYTPERKAEILRADHERARLRGWERTCGVARQTVATWLRAAAVARPDTPTVAAAQAPHGLELDELWSLVGSQKTTAGSGSPCGGAPVKAWLILSVTVVRRGVGACGVGFQLPSATVPP